MNSMKCRIQLEKIRPSDGNPREDMGDLEELAHRIAATGGEPVNPLVVVRDGEVYRLVDGERRYRALKLLGADAVDCLVFMDFPEAMEAVAAMATDDKKPLTDEERTRGFQSMLVLGVDEAQGAGALGVDVERFRRARRAARAIKPETARIPGLEALVLAGDEDFTDEEMAEIIDAASERGGEAVVAEKIRRRKRDEARVRAILDALPEGMRVFGEHSAMVEWASREGVSLAWDASLSSPRDAPEGFLDEAGREMVACPSGPNVILYRKVERSDERDEERERERAERDARNAALASLQSTWLDAIRRDRSLLAAMDEAAVEDRVVPWWAAQPDDGEDDPIYQIVEDAAGSMPGMWERAMALGKVARMRSLDDWDGKRNAPLFVMAYDGLADLQAWEPSDADEDLRAHAIEIMGGEHG